MKSKVMDRPMFKKGEDFDPENVGIMSGFKDMDIDELFEDEMEGDDLYDSSDMLDRRPDSPEILMNNLRGDMRSVDARREELADMVGYNAAMETPEEVLALLQGTLGGGIGGLAGAPEPAPMMPPPGPAAQGPGMPPPEMGGMMPGMGMPPEMGGMPPPEMGGMPAPEAAPPMPGGMPPLNMYQGGIVQRFSEGSDEDAVTPAESGASSSAVSPQQLELIRFISQQARRVPSSGDLRSAMESRMPLYQDVLGTGGGKEMAQAQMLFDISGAALGYASNRGPQGEVLKGSPLARLAGATRALPGQIAARAGDVAKQEQAVKLAALQSAERAMEKQQEFTTRAQIEAIKAAGKGQNVFGTGLKGQAYNNAISLADGFVNKTLTPQQENIFLSAANILSQPEYYVDEMGYRRQQPANPPAFLVDALKARPDARLPRAATGVAGEPTAAAPGQEGAGTLAVSPAMPVGGTYGVRPEKQIVDGVDIGKFSLWEASKLGTGFINVPLAYISRYPLLGETAVGEQQANAFLSSAINQINRGIATNPRFSEGERQQIAAQLNMDPSMLLNPEAFKNRLIGLDRLMLTIRNIEEQKVQNPNIPAAAKNDARTKVAEVDGIRQIMGIPQARVVRNEKDFNDVPVGAAFWVFNKDGTAQLRKKAKP
jgi:hypothetical protein